MRTWSDKDLVVAFLKSDNRSLSPYNEIVRRYEPLVFSVCFKYFRNRELAEEMTQEAFLKVYGQLSQLQNPSQLKSWLMRMAVNLCTDFYRKRAHQKKIKEEAHRILNNEPSHKDHKAPENSKQVALQEAIERLKDKDKQMIMMHYFSELSISEIADQLEIGESAVKMRLSRCREKILGYMNKIVTSTQ